MPAVKYAVIIADGAADFPLDELDGRTPLEAATTPNLDALSLRGRLGTAATTPPGFAAGSDVCSMSLLGYDPAKFHTGRAPLEAAALGLSPAPTDWVLRLNLVTVGPEDGSDAGLMLDHSAGAITSDETRELVAALAAFWREREPALSRGLALTPGVSYRSILVDSSGTRDYSGIMTAAPHEIPREPWRDHLPRAESSDKHAVFSADLLGRLIDLSREVLPGHPINLARAARGQRTANMAWIWGQGVRPAMPLFADRFELRGAMTTAVDLLAGIAALIGWERLDVPGATSYHDNDYAGQGRAACEALDEFGIVCCHVESPDEASHQGDARTKIAAIEAIDRFIVGPVVERLERFGDAERDTHAEGWRVLVMPDHYTLVSTRRHDATPSPFVMAGAWVRAAAPRARYTEAEAQASDLHVNPGHDLMEYFLRGGLARVPTGIARVR